MAGHFQIYAKNAGPWETVGQFDGPDDLTDAKAEADHFVESGKFDSAIVVEKIAGNDKAKYKPIYRKTTKHNQTPKSRSKIDSKPLELLIKKGLTGEWIAIPEVYAKRHKYYDVNGFLAWICVIFVINPFLGVIGYFGGYMSVPAEGILILTGIFAIDFAIEWGLAWALWKKKKWFPGCAVGFSTLIAILSLLTLDVIGLGKSLFLVTYILVSQRVNVVYKHRIRRQSLEYTIPPKKLENAKFISVKTQKKRKRKQRS